jgi:hypothetical protein
MPSLPRPHRALQPFGRESLQATALRLAVQLTPMQRHLVVRAGLPRWLELPRPFRPHPGRQLAAARALASVEYRLLEQLHEAPMSYQLTLLGELVAGIWLTAALCDPEPVAPLPFHPSPVR